MWLRIPHAWPPVTFLVRQPVTKLHEATRHRSPPHWPPRQSTIRTKPVSSASGERRIAWRWPRAEALAAAMQGATAGPSHPTFDCVNDPVVSQQVVVTRLPLHEMAGVLAEPNEAAPIVHAPDEYSPTVALPGQAAHLLAGLHPGQRLGEVAPSRSLSDGRRPSAAAAFARYGAQVLMQREASRTAIASPMPDDAPVTRATLVLLAVVMVRFASVRRDGVRKTPACGFARQPRHCLCKSPL